MFTGSSRNIQNVEYQTVQSPNTSGQDGNYSQFEIRLRAKKLNAATAMKWRGRSNIPWYYSTETFSPVSTANIYPSITIVTLFSSRHPFSWAYNAWASCLVFSIAPVSSLPKKTLTTNGMSCSHFQHFIKTKRSLSQSKLKIIFLPQRRSRTEYTTRFYW